MVEKRVSRRASGGELSLKQGSKLQRIRVDRPVADKILEDFSQGGADVMPGRDHERGPQGGFYLVYRLAFRGQLIDSRFKRAEDIRLEEFIIPDNELITDFFK